MTDLEKLFDTHTHRFDAKTRAIIQLNEPFSGDFPPCFSFGIHPKEAITADFERIEHTSNQLIENPGFLAFGEIGLDNRYDTVKEQEALYVFQLKLASNLQKPVILHCVNSWDRCRFLHEITAPETVLIYHGFNKSSILESVLNYPKAMISIGESVITNPKLQKAIEMIPLSRLLLETDTGSGALIDTYHAVAEIKNISLQALIEPLEQNAKRIFKYE
ncbi:Tat-linked quality control protein TatD [compost metagenome]